MENRYFPQGICQFLEHCERPKSGRGQLKRGREPRELFENTVVLETKLGVQDCQEVNIDN